MRTFVCGLLVGVFGPFVLATVVLRFGWIPLAATSDPPRKDVDFDSRCASITHAKFRTTRSATLPTDTGMTLVTCALCRRELVCHDGMALILTAVRGVAGVVGVLAYYAPSSRTRMTRAGGKIESISCGSPLTIRRG